MAKPRLKWNRRGLYDLRRAPGVVADLEKRAEAIAAAAESSAAASGWPDAKYATGSQQGVRRPQGRWRTSVVTANAEAMLDNAKNDTLLRNLSEGA